MVPPLQFAENRFKNEAPILQVRRDYPPA